MHVYYLTIVLASITALFSQVAKKTTHTPQIPSANPMQKITAGSFFVFLTFLILALVAGLRWEVGADYWQYAKLYPYYSATALKDFFSPRLYQLNIMGIRGISILSKHIYDDPATMFFLSSFITIGLYVWRIAKSSKMFAFSILLYILIGSWHGSFNGVRQFLASAIIFAGSSFIIQKKFYKYALVVILASLFHSSALVMLPVYFIAIRKTDTKQWLLLIAIAVAMITSYDVLFKIAEIALDKDMSVMTPYMARRVNILRVGVSFAPLVLYFLVRGKYKKDPESNFYINMLIVNAALKVGTINSAYLMRVGIYTGAFTILALPKLLECFDKRSALLLKFIIVGLYAIFWYVEVRNVPNLYNFKWIFAK